MAQYSLSPQTDQNKIFLVNRSELDGRIDSTYILQKIKVKRKFNYPTIKLNKLVKSLTGGTPSKEQKEYWNGDIYWVSPKDFKQFYIDKAEDTITDLGLKNSSTKLIPENSILIVVRSGVLIHTLPVAINTIPVAINQDVKALIPSDKILSAYLGYYFNIFNDELLPLIVKHSTTVQSVNTNEFDRLEIPVPSLEEQQIMINILDIANAIKRQKEAEAKALLESIDAYLLGELGITLPEQDNSLQNRIFTTKFSEIGGGRLDSSYYSVINRKIIQAISKAIYPIDEIKNYCEFVPGYAFSSDYYVESSDCILVTIKNISQNTVDLNNSTFLPSDFYYKYENFRINKDDLLIAMTGATIGKVGIFDDDKRALINQRNGIIKSRRLNTIYLMSLLNTEIYQSIILRNSVGGAQPNISEKNITKIEVPIPPLEKQTEIANHIQDIRSQAKALQQEAARTLEVAKREVEKMILGG
jgi:restriction endonuclease S subunit